MDIHPVCTCVYMRVCMHVHVCVHSFIGLDQCLNLMWTLFFLARSHPNFRPYDPHMQKSNPDSIMHDKKMETFCFATNLLMTA